MYLRMAKRLLLETDKRLLWKLVWNFGLGGVRAVQKHKARLNRGNSSLRFSTSLSLIAATCAAKVAGWM